MGFTGVRVIIGEGGGEIRSELEKEGKTIMTRVVGVRENIDLCFFRQKDIITAVLNFTLSPFTTFLANYFELNHI